MKQSVQDNYTRFTTEMEGKMPFMCLDVRGLVTAGIGNLIDPIGLAMNLPWRRPDGSLASQEEIRSAWYTVKARTDLAQKRGGAFANLTNLRLDDEGIRQLVFRKLMENERILQVRWPTYDAWPADAQLAVLSMAWNAGPYFRAPKFDAAANGPVPDFRTMARESHFNSAVDGAIEIRNVANRKMFLYAAEVMERGLDFERLVFDTVKNTFASLAREVGKGAIAAQTEFEREIASLSQFQSAISERKGASAFVTIAGLTSIGYLGYKYWNLKKA